MCFRPTEEETARSEVRQSAAMRDEHSRRDREERRDPSAYPEPRGNQDTDEREVERSADRLSTVLGH